MMILLSQAYILRRMWGIKTNNKSYLKCLSKSWMFHLFIKNNFKIFLREQGILSYSELSNFGEKNRNGWIEPFNRYNLSPKIWYSIAPKKWRLKVSEHWRKNTVLDTRESRNLIFSERTDDSSIFSINFLVGKTKKSHKLFRKNLSISNSFNSNKNWITNNFSQLNEKSKHNNLIMNRIQKYSSISNKKRISPDFLVSEKNIFFGYNLLLWFIPELVGQRTKYKYKKVLNFNTSVAKNKNLEMFRNKELLREREINQSIRQWRWKSRNYEKKFEKLGNMASLMTFMQNQETMISLSGKMRKDLDLFRLFLRRNNNFNRLAINSEHRLPRPLDDQVLIYKLVGASANFKHRLRKLSNLENINEYFSDSNISKDDKKHIISYNSFNLEDILLPKHRREFRIFNSLVSRQKGNIESTEKLLEKIRSRKREIGTNKNRIIKRFIWSSYRFEDLACMNRFWFSTMNGDRFSMLRFRIYPII